MAASIGDTAKKKNEVGTLMNELEKNHKIAN